MTMYRLFAKEIVKENHMKQYYLDRFRWIFTYRKRSFGYCLAKTVCLILGVPLYAVLFAVEMLLTLINMLFSVIPLLNVIVLTVCKLLIYICDGGFWLCVLPDISAYRAAHREEPEYSVSDESDDESILPTEENETEPVRDSDIGESQSRETSEALSSEEEQ